MGLMDSIGRSLARSDEQLFLPEEDGTFAPEPDTNLLDEKALKKLQDGPEGASIREAIKKQYERSKNDRSVLQRKWYEHLAFERGDQYVFWDKTHNKLDRVPRTNAFTPRMTVNILRPATRTEISKLTSQKPTATSFPASNDEEDWRASLAAEQLWSSLYDRLNVGRTMRKTARWMSIIGTGFQKTVWNGDLYDPVNEMYGDVQIKSVSPFNIFVPDLAEEELEDQPMMIHAYTIPVEQAMLSYGDVLPPDHKPKVVGSSEIVDYGFLGLGQAGANSGKPDASLVLEAWIKPGFYKRYPRGAYVLLVDDVIVEASLDGFPPGYMEYPVTKFDHIHTGGFYAASIYDDTIAIQREVNRTHSQIIESKNRMTKPQMFYRAGSLNPAMITSKPGQYIEVKQGFDYPTPVQMQPLPSYVREELDDLMARFEDITAQHSSTKGRATPGLDAATAIAFMTEQDESMLAPSSASIEEGLTKVARNAMTLCTEYYDTPRLVKVVGEDNGFDVVELQGADIARGSDIRIEAGSAVSNSKSARQALVIDLAKYGIIQPDQALDLIELPLISQFNATRDAKADENKAKRENIRFAKLQDQEIEQHYADWNSRQEQGDPSTFAQDPEQDEVTGETIMDESGQPQRLPLEAPAVITVDELDDHAVHLRVHSLKRKSQSYETMSDTAKAELDKHIKQHQQAMLNQMMGQQSLDQGQAAAAAPQGAGAGSDPKLGTWQNAPEHEGKTKEQVDNGEGAPTSAETEGAPDNL